MLKKLLGFFLIAIIFCSALYAYKVLYVSSLNNTKSSYSIYIKKHDSLTTVLKSLDSKTNIFVARLYAKALGVGNNLFVGEYEVAPNDNLHNIMTKFASGDVVFRHFTIVEGWNYYQLLLALANDNNLLHVIDENSVPKINGSAEGAYFPDTYFYTYPDTDVDILKRANAKMINILHSEYKNKSTMLNSEYDALIIASLLEKEALYPYDKYAISGVIQNRMRRHMRLQIDAAVYYGMLQKNMGHINRALDSHDMKDRSNRYNTYAYDGLPPTPIAMPSLTSIRAACRPQENKYLYYVVKNDNSNTHHFSLNFRDHRKAIRKLR